MDRWWSFVFGLSALLLASCSSSGNATPAVPTATAPAASATPTSSPTMAAMSIQVYVPSATETAAADGATRHSMFVSPGTKSLVAHITEPDVLPSPLQDRTEAHNVSPGFNTITLYAPPGTVTIVLRLYSQSNGTGAELGRSDPNDSSLEDIDLDGIHPVQLSATIDPIVVAVQLIVTSKTRPAGCKGATGQAVAVAVDVSGNKVYGAGKFLDTNEHYVTYRIVPASPPSRPANGFTSVFTTALSIGGTIASGTTTIPFVESNPAYDENKPSTVGTYVWYYQLSSSTASGLGGATAFDALECLPGIGG